MTLTEAPSTSDTQATGARAATPVTSGAPASGARRQAFTASVVTRVLGLLSVLILGFVGYLLLLAPLEQHANQQVLYSKLRGPIAEGVPPYAGRAVRDGTVVRAVPPIYDDGEDVLIPPGAPIAVIDSPALGARQLVVVEGTSSGDLLAGPGHRRDTVLPGQRGVSLIYGRATTFGGPFKELPNLHQGDEITVVTFQGRFAYRVEGVRRDGDPVPDVAPVLAGGSRLTMVTAEGSNLLQPGHTVFVDAILQGTAQPAAQHPGVIPPEEHSLAGDRPALLTLVLWLQGLALLTMAMAWARVRWGRWETYLVGLPAVLALLWNVYESAARLLPNLV
jgi:sortase A